MDTRFTTKTRHPLTRVGHLFQNEFLMLTVLLPAKDQSEFPLALDWTMPAGCARHGQSLPLPSGERQTRRPSRRLPGFSGRMGNFRAALLLHSDLDVLALDLYAIETDFTVGLQSIESGFRIRCCAS